MWCKTISCGIMGKCAALNVSTRIHSLLGQQFFLKVTASEKASKGLLIGMVYIYIYKTANSSFSVDLWFSLFKIDFQLKVVKTWPSTQPFWQGLWRHAHVCHAREPPFSALDLYRENQHGSEQISSISKGKMYFCCITIDRTTRQTHRRHFLERKSLKV